MNRLLELFETPEEDLPYGDFYVVSGEFGSACVTRETAEYIERRLSRLWVPRWIAFSDRVGSRVCVRSKNIRTICESTAAQRAQDRRLDRAREREYRADRPSWENDD
jgi:hypothetical protein